MDIFLPFLLVIFASVFQGSFGVGMKYMAPLKWEAWWLVHVTIAMIAFPLIWALIAVPDLFGIIADAPSNAILLGMLFAFSYIYTGDLSWPIGIHFGWNVFQNNLFGFSNSGKATEVSILKFDLHKSPWLNGGDFGLEASLLSTIILVIGIILFLIQIRKTNPTLQPKISLYNPSSNSVTDDWNDGIG